MICVPIDLIAASRPLPHLTVTGLKQVHVIIGYVFVANLLIRFT